MAHGPWYGYGHGGWYGHGGYGYGGRPIATPYRGGYNGYNGGHTAYASNGYRGTYNGGGYNGALRLPGTALPAVVTMLLRAAATMRLPVVASTAAASAAAGIPWRRWWWIPRRWRWSPVIESAKTGKACSSERAFCFWAQGTPTPLVFSWGWYLILCDLS